MLEIPDANKIEAYLDEYVGNNRSDLDFILRFWGRDKAKLYQLLGNKYQVSRAIEYHKPVEEVKTQIDNCSEINIFRNHYYDRMVYNKDFSFYVQSRLENLVSNTTLATNTYEGTTFKIPLPTGKYLTVQNGCKPSRLLGKIATAFDIDGYEEFRIAQSRIFNDRKVKGTLTLSIHPLDFMTMSDNDYSWTSCMNWADEGCYRRGTVEMMNSECVLVAYLSDSEMSIPGHYTWNSKQWRNLVIVTPDVVSCVKGYPNQSNTLDNRIMEFVRDLAKENWNEEYQEVLTIKPTENGSDYNGDSFTVKGEHFTFSCDTMYNDFGNNARAIHRTHMMFNKNFVFEPDEWYEVNYSGMEECMCCGNTIVYFDDESKLICEDCEPHYVCANCGDQYNGTPAMEVEEGALCECCADNAVLDSFTEEYHGEDYCDEIECICHGATRDYEVIKYIYKKNNIEDYLIDRDQYSERAHEYSRLRTFEVDINNILEEYRYIFE